MKNITDSTFEQIKRICLFEKTKGHLPGHIFTDIYCRIHNNEQVIQDLFMQYSEALNVKEKGIPKPSFIINHDN